jgi:hypothetical protein
MPRLTSGRRSVGVIGGVERKLHFFAFDLPHSDAGFVVAYPAETTDGGRGGQTFETVALFLALQSEFDQPPRRSAGPAAAVANRRFSSAM